MRLLLVSTQRTWGGGENVLAQLATGAASADAKVSVAAAAGGAVERWAREQAGLDLLSMPNRGRGPRGMWSLRRWVASNAPDVVLLNDPHAITFGGAALAGLGVPRVGVKHTCFPVRSAWKHNRLVERVVCVAEAARQECLAAGVAPDRLDVVHSGLDRMAPNVSEVAAARRTFQSQDCGAKNVLAIGNLFTVKGFDTLIRAVSRPTERPWRLWIAGEGPERPALEALIAELGVADRVTLLGFRRDVGALLVAADAFASASHREGLSLVLVEAMQAGTPVVATPVGGNGEALLIDRPGESTVARAVAPGDPAAMAAAITASLEAADANVARVEAAKRWAGEHFTVERMTRDYLAVFERLVAGRRSPRRAA